MLGRLLLIFLTCFSVANINAQQPLSSVKITNSSQKIINRTSYLPSSRKHLAPRIIEFTEQTVTTANFITNINAYFNISDEFTFVVKESSTDQIGMQHHFLQQYYFGIPLEGLGYRIHEKNGFVTSANGKGIQELALDTEIALSEEQAFDLAVKYLQTKDTVFRNGKKLIVSKDYTFTAESFAVAYQFDIDVSLIERWRISIDATDGHVINKESLVKNCHGVRPLEYDTGTGMTNYYGTQTIRVDKSENGSSRLEGQSEHGGKIETYDFRNASLMALFFNDYKVYSFYSSNNNFNSSYQKPAVSVQWAVEQAFEYYYKRHNRVSFDNMGTTITSFVHVDEDWDNAAWSKNRLIFGDGSNNNPLVELDVVSHELTHGVTDYEADLTYMYESGALNESFSDIMAKAVEFTIFVDTATWLLAKHFRDGGLRNMSDPNLKEQPDTYLGDMWYIGYEDQGGVHTNSGVQNYWFYLLCEGGSGINDRGDSYTIQPISMDTVVNIVYRNLTEYLIPSSDYLDCRIGSLLATADLYGKNSSVYEEIDKAWDAVGVIDEPIITSLDLYDITATTVKLKGSLLPRGDTITYHFEYGITPDFGGSTEVYEYDGTVDGIITGLQSETKYYVRLVATNENGSTNKTTEFTTISLAPLVKIKNTVDVTDTSAILYGEINPNSLQTNFYFEYGPTPEMEMVTPSYPLSDTTEYMHVSVPVTDLIPRQTYYYKLIAANSFASSDTDSVSFFTAIKPIINSFTPTSAEIGEEVTIMGHGFNLIAEKNMVSFGATRALVLSSEATELRVAVPKGASFGPVSLLDSESGLATESTQDFTPTFTGDFGKGSLQLRAAIEDIAYSHLEVQDMDGDGRPDLVASQNDGITVFQNINTGEDITNESFIQSNIPIDDSFYLQGIADFDGNGLKDIIGYNQQTIRIYPNFSVPGFIFFGVPINLEIGQWRNLQLDDFDNDGHIDIAGIAALSGDSILFSIFRNQSPKGKLAPSSFELQYSKILPYNYIQFLTTVDLNSDGLPDLLASIYNSDFFSVLENKSNCGLFEFEEIVISDTIRGRYTNYLAQDLNQDDLKDIVSYTLYDNGKMTFLEAEDTGIHYMKPIITLEGETKNSVRPGDINGDGNVDLLIGDYDGRFMFFKNNTEPAKQLSGNSFELFEHYGVNENAHEVRTYVFLNDLNGDGRPEVINDLNYSFYPYKGNQLEIWQNTPNDCPDPMPITISVTKNTATIELPPNSSLDQFEIEYAPIGATRWWEVTSTTLNNLYTGATYQLRARAKCYLGFTGYHYIEFTTACVDLSSFSISDVQMNSVTLNATSLSDFEIQYAEAGTDEWTSVYQYSSYISYLTQGTTYDLRYRGRCYTPGEFVYTQFTTLCPELSTLLIKDASYNRAEVSWTSNYEGNAKLEYSDDEMNWIVIDSTQIMNPLLPGTQYFVRGSLECNSINSEFIYTSFITPCPKVSTISVSEITPFNALISWNDESATGSYEIRYSQDDGEEQIAVSNTTSFYLDGLNPGTAYRISVAPECSGSKVFSSFTFTTFCYIPFNLTVDDVSYTSAALSWNENYSGIPYLIDYAIVGSDVWMTIESETTCVSLEDLRPGTQYQTRIHINCPSTQGQYASMNFETKLYKETRFAPNPTENTIRIYPSRNLIGNQYGLFDNTGKMVMDGELLDYTFDLSGFSAGTYILKIEGEKPFKIVKQ